MSTTRRNVRDFLSSGRLLFLLIAIGFVTVLLQRIPMPRLWSHASAAAEVLIGAMLVVTGAALLLHRS